MTEGTPRDPHERIYERDGRYAYHVSDHGIVQISEELLHDLLTAAGFTEITGQDKAP